MTPDQVKRKLAAILSADVQGYSRLMGEDEEFRPNDFGMGNVGLNIFFMKHSERVIIEPIINTN